jgi:hypothetical protein
MNARNFHFLTTSFASAREGEKNERTCRIVGRAGSMNAQQNLLQEVFMIARDSVGHVPSHPSGRSPRCLQSPFLSAPPYSRTCLDPLREDAGEMALVGESGGQRDFAQRLICV